MARQNHGSRGPPACRTLLPAIRCLAAFAPGSAARSVDRGPKAQGVETATPDPRDRCDPGNAVDRADPNTPQVPHQVTTMELQRSGARNVWQCAILRCGRTTATF